MQQCFNCAETEAALKRSEIANCELTEQLSGYISEHRKLLGEITRLKNELNGSTSKESQKVREVCTYHAEQWKKLNPRARGLSYDMAGKNAIAVRRGLRLTFDGKGLTVDDLKAVIDVVFASDFHRSKPNSYLTLESIFRDENRIRRHLDGVDRSRDYARSIELLEKEKAMTCLDRIRRSAQLALAHCGACGRPVQECFCGAQEAVA